MSELRQTQSDFQAYLLGNPSRVVERVAGTGSLSAEARLDVYAAAYRLRLLEALETDFVALRAHLGSEKFRALGEAYIAAHPSQHPSLRYFGRHMATFLETAEPYARNSLFAELAAFDWALTTAFDAADDPEIIVEDLGRVAATDWPSLCFRPHASVLRLNLQWNAPAIWKAADSGAETLPDPQRAADPIPWVIWRQDLNTFFRSLEVDEAYALDAAIRGETFAAICEGMCEWIDAGNVAARAAGFLRQWVADGMLREFSV